MSKGHFPSHRAVTRFHFAHCKKSCFSHLSPKNTVKEVHCVSIRGEHMREQAILFAISRAHH